MSALIASMFANGQQGYWGSASDLTDAKVAWRKNQLASSDSLLFSAWSKTDSTIGQNAIASPGPEYGMGDLVTEGSAGTATISQAISIDPGSIVGFQIVLWRGNHDWVRVNVTDSSFSNGYRFWVNLATGTIGTQFAVGTGALTTPITITPMGGGAYLLKGAGRMNPASSLAFLGTVSAVANNDGTRVAGGTRYQVGHQLEVGGITSYQKISENGAYEFMKAFPTNVNFVDNLGQVPVMSVESLTGLAGDRRFEGKRGPELVINGDFKAGIANWSTAAGAQLDPVPTGMSVTATSANYAQGYQQVAATIGNYYEVTGMGTKVSGSIGWMLVGDAGNNQRFGVFALLADTPVRTIIQAVSNNLRVTFQTHNAAAGLQVIAQQASIKEFYGNHALQATTTARPILSARVNKNLNYNANPFDLATIAKTGDAASVLSIVDDTAALAAAGLSNICTSGKVYKFDNSAGTGTAWAGPDGTVGNLNPHTISIWGRTNGTNGRLDLANILATFNNTAYARISGTGTPTATNNKLLVAAPAGSIVYFVLNQLEEGSTLSRVQTTMGATRYDYVGWPRYFRFDGQDDYLATTSLVWNTGTLTATVGFVSQQSAAVAALFESGASSINAGRFAMFMPLSANSARTTFRSNGASGNAVNVSSATAVGQPVVTTGMANTSASVATIRQNGVQVESLTTAQGGGNWETNPLNIGARFSPLALPFNGRIYEIVFRGAETPDNTRLERFINKAMGGVYS